MAVLEIQDGYDRISAKRVAVDIHQVYQVTCLTGHIADLIRNGDSGIGGVVAVIHQGDGKSGADEYAFVAADAGPVIDRNCHQSAVLSVD
jgi:hypothetical protein